MEQVDITADEIWEDIAHHIPNHEWAADIKETIKEHLVRLLAKGSNDPIGDLIERERRFNQFWNAYDKKVAQPLAMRAWGKLKEKDIDAILKNVEAYVLAHPDKKFRPNPATYLNQRRWEDELPEGFKPKPNTINLNVKENKWNYGV